MEDLIRPLLGTYQAVLILVTNDRVKVDGLWHEGDTLDKGSGHTLQQAVDDLKVQAEYREFCDNVSYILTHRTHDGAPLLDNIKRRLKEIL